MCWSCSWSSEIPGASPHRLYQVLLLPEEWLGWLDCKLDGLSRHYWVWQVKLGILQIMFITYCFNYRTLMICNYINKLPRCQEDAAEKFLRSDSASDSKTIVARQTSHQLQLEVGQVGYYSVPLESSSHLSGSSSTVVNVTLALIMSLVSVCFM